MSQDKFEFTEKSKSFAKYLRKMVGGAEILSYLLFPKGSFSANVEQKLQYLEFIAKLQDFIDPANDILSYHKEYNSDSGDNEEMNYVGNYAAAHGKDHSTVLNKIVDKTIEVSI